jgi:hypothetical protein
VSGAVGTLVGVVLAPATLTPAPPVVRRDR